MPNHRDTGVNTNMPKGTNVTQQHMIPNDRYVIEKNIEKIDQYRRDKYIKRKGLLNICLPELKMERTPIGMNRMLMSIEMKYKSKAFDGETQDPIVNKIDIIIKIIKIDILNKVR